MFFSPPKLKDMNCGDKEGIYYIPFDSKYVKFEFTAEEARGGKNLPDKVGNRIWIDSSAPVINPLDKKYFRIRIAVKKKKQNILSLYEIHESSYDLITRKLIEVQDSLDKPQWHTKLASIKDNELFDWSIARFRKFENEQSAEFQDLAKQLIGQEKQLPFLPPNETVLLQLADFSHIEFNVQKWNSTQTDEIEKALANLYLDDVRLGSIKKWLLFDLFKKGKVKHSSEKSGIILYGPPGTGKTVAIDESLRIIFKNILGYEFKVIPVGNIVGGDRSGIVGGFAKTLADIYSEAFNWISLNRKPYIIFIDEGDDLIRDVADKDDNNSSWLHQGQVILKNYMNPKRYPGVLFVISTNIIDGTSFNPAFSDQRLGLINFPIPNFNRYEGLWSSNHPKGLRAKLFSQTSYNFEPNHIQILADLCSDILTLRLVADFCEDYNNKLVKLNSFDFDKFKDNLVVYAGKKIIEELNIDLKKCRTEKEVGERRKLFKFQEKNLRRISLGLTNEEANEKTFLRNKAIRNDNLLGKEYDLINSNLRALLRKFDDSNGDWIVSVAEINCLITLIDNFVESYEVIFVDNNVKSYILNVFREVRIKLSEIQNHNFSSNPEIYFNEVLRNWVTKEQVFGIVETKSNLDLGGGSSIITSLSDEDRKIIRR